MLPGEFVTLIEFPDRIPDELIVRKSHGTKPVQIESNDPRVRNAPRSPTLYEDKDIAMDETPVEQSRMAGTNNDSK